MKFWTTKRSRATERSERKKATAPADLRVRVELVYHRLPADLVELHDQDPADISRVFHAQEILIPLR